jgi:hypothetical protein
MAMSEEPSFEQQVATAAKEAGVVEVPAESADAPAPVPSIPAGSQDEPAALAAPKAEEPPPPPQTVPLAVHIRQREKHDREVRELREQFNVGNQRLQQLMQSLQPAPPPAPDPNVDPLGAALSKLDTLEANVNQVVTATAEERKTAQLRQQIAQFERAVYEDEQAYKAEVPDLGEAMAYAKDTKFREYVALGMDAQQAAARVQQDAFALASHAFQNGLSPSDLVYRMAHALGYKRAAPATTAATVASAAGAPARDADGRFVAPSAAEAAIEMRAAGSERAKGGGGAPENLGPITLQQLATMDNDEFAKLTSGKNWNKLMGG